MRERGREHRLMDWNCQGKCAVAHVEQGTRGYSISWSGLDPGFGHFLRHSSFDRRPPPQEHKNAVCDKQLFARPPHCNYLIANITCTLKRLVNASLTVAIYFKIENHQQKCSTLGKSASCQNHLLASASDGVRAVALDAY